jgi:hypothetical protein
VKIIIELATTIDEMIAKMKYPSVFRSCICSSVGRSNLFKRSFQRINIFLQNIVVSFSSKILRGKYDSSLTMMLAFSNVI